MNTQLRVVINLFDFSDDIKSSCHSLQDNKSSSSFLHDDSPAVDTDKLSVTAASLENDLSSEEESCDEENV